MKALINGKIIEIDRPKEPKRVVKQKRMYKSVHVNSDGKIEKVFGFTYRSKHKKVDHSKDAPRSLDFKSNSDKWQQAGIYKGARIMKKRGAKRYDVPVSSCGRRKLTPKDFDKVNPSIK